MTHKKVKYLCDFCNREYSKEANAKKHEKQCYRDPENRACATCKHFYIDIDENHYLAGGEDHIREIRYLACDIDKAYVIDPVYGNEIESPVDHCDWWEGKETL